MTHELNVIKIWGSQDDFIDMSLQPSVVIVLKTLNI